MSTFFIANIRIKDGEKFQEYARKAAETLAAHGGEPLLRGKLEEQLVGDTEHPMVGIVRFPNASALKAWYRSPEYQAIVPLRESAAEMVLTSYSEAV